jgi:AcrR family transcriptional regulator
MEVYLSQQPESLRVRRTRKLLRDALIELIEEHGFDSLTVGEVTSRAMVSRAAFYRNYQDKYDLVEQIFFEAMNELNKAVTSPEYHTPENFARFFDHILEYERMYRALLGRKGSPWFVLKMRSALIDVIKSWQAPGTIHIFPPDDDMVPDIVAAMLIEAVVWWLENGKPYSSQEMTNRCLMLVSAVFAETRNWK